MQKLSEEYLFKWHSLEANLNVELSSKLHQKFSLTDEQCQELIHHLLNEPHLKHNVIELATNHYQYQLMWDDSDIFYNKHCVRSIPVPYMALPDGDRLAYLENEHEQLNKSINKLLTLSDFRSALKYYMKQSDMWITIQTVYHMIFTQAPICATAPTITSDFLLNDWTDNWRLGAMIYIMIKKQIVPYVTDFYCPNT